MKYQKKKNYKKKKYKNDENDDIASLKSSGRSLDELPVGMNSLIKVPEFEKNKNKHINEKTPKVYNSDLCKKGITFSDCELAILRNAVDETGKVQGAKMADSDDIRKMVSILERFLIDKKLVCYGGTAINNILPKFAQFYDRSLEIPDYDFFSANALDDSKALADMYFKEGYEEVEAKSGMHPGTYKVFVNFIPMADVTYLPKELFNSLSKDAIVVAGIKYAPPNYLRMSMYLELSRPAGDVSRWEKVLKRLTLLNKYFPLKTAFDCNTIDFQRKMENDLEDSEKIYFTVRDAFIELGVIFFGGYASSLYSRYMPNEQKHLVEKMPDFDVLSEDPTNCATIVKERLDSAGFKNVKEILHDAIGEIIPEHIEIRVGKETIAFIYKPIACHNYNTIRIDNKEINVATIDTMLSFYLAFYYADAPYYYKDRILCMSTFLFEVEQKNRLAQKGLLKRFSINCYGAQETMESIRARKAAKFKELKSKRGEREYEEWFLKYIPGLQKSDGSKKTMKHKDKKDKKSYRFQDPSLPPISTVPSVPSVPSQDETEINISQPKKKRNKTVKKKGFFTRLFL